MNPTQFAQIPVFGALIPKEGPRSIPLSLDFTTQQSYVVDLTVPVQQKQISLIQSVFIDNSQNSTPVSAVCNQTGQKVVCPPNAQGVFPLLAPNPPVITFSSIGAVVVQAQLLNIPYQPQVWPAQKFLNSYDGNGYLYVDDPNIASVVSNGNLKTIVNITDASDKIRPYYGGSYAYQGNFSTGTQTLITGAPYSFITQIFADFSSDATLATAGRVSVSLTDNNGAVTLWSKQVYLPSTPLDNRPIPVFDMQSIQYLSAYANSSIQISLGTALSTGVLNYLVLCGTTSA